MVNNGEFENYRKEKLTIDLVWANVFGFLLMIPITLIFGLPYYFIWGKDLNIEHLKSIINSITPGIISGIGLTLFIISLLGIITHELIHGITWSRFTLNGFKSMKFGVLWKMLTPYCHCKEPLKVKHYIIGAIMPAIILGFIPAIVAVVIGNLGLLVFGIFFTIAACGDFLIINLIRKENMNSWVQDHPSEAGCFVYRIE